MADTFTNEDILQQMLKHAGGSERTHGVGGWNVSPETILDAMSKIAWHESRGVPTAVQETLEGGRGQGRGLYQYSAGEDKGGHLAIDRAIRYFELNNPEIGVPQWLTDEMDAGWPYDISDLDTTQQSILFLADKMKDETANMSQIGTDEGLAEFWLDEHWAGPPKDRDAKLEAWNTSMGVYKDTLLDQLFPKSNAP